MLQHRFEQEHATIQPEIVLAESDRGMAGGLRFDHFVRLFAGDSQRFDQSPFLDA